MAVSHVASSREGLKVSGPQGAARPVPRSGKALETGTFRD
jgi:hypothetical protein